MDQCISSDPQTLAAFTIDDGYTSWVEVVDPILEKHNLSITGFINDVEEGHNVKSRITLTWDAVKTLAETGRWEFGWHGTDHFLLTGLTSEKEEEQIAGFDELFEEHSLPRPRTFCYPYGGYDFSTMRTASKYFPAARTVSEGANTVYWVKEHPMEIKVTRIYEERDNDYYEGMISENLNRGVFIVFYLHSVEEPIATKEHPIEITSEDFEKLIGWLVEQDVKIVSFSQGIEEMKSRDFQVRSSIKFDNPLQTRITSQQIPMPSRYWETTLFFANFFGRYVPFIGDLLLKYWAPVTVFIVLSLVFCLANSIILIRRSDRS